jgi:Ribonuclease G/E
VAVHPSVGDYLLNDRRSDLVALEAKYHKSIVVTMDPAIGPEEYEIRYR